MIVDGNVPYLDWASSFIPLYNVTNETKAVENTTLSDTNEAFTFRDNFIEKKYGTLPPNHTIFAGLDLESNSNSSMQRIPRQNNKSYQDLLDRIKKGEQFPPGAKFPGMEMEQDDELRALSEQQQEPIRENLRLLWEQRNREARRNFRMRQRCMMNEIHRNSQNKIFQDITNKMQQIIRREKCQDIINETQQIIRGRNARVLSTKRSILSGGRYAQVLSTKRRRFSGESNAKVSPKKCS
ncbi:hypothetical protein U1Q18_050930 [Sarracenia purpurea var. burkii]